MKDYKWGKGLGFIALCALGGALIGFCMQLFMSMSDLPTMKAVFNQFVPNLFWVSFLCGIIGIGGYFYFNNLLKKDGYSNDEGSVFDRYENKMSIVMTFSTVCAIVNFTAFGMNLLNDLADGYLLLFIANVVLAFMGEVANVSLVKKVRPELNADPVDIGFNKDYFDKLDECEKIKVGKASYKTISAMTIVYLAVFVICWLLIMSLEVSPIICLPIGVIWLVQTILLGYHSCKQK